MKAVVFRLSMPRYALGRLLGHRFPSLYYGPLSCVSCREVPEPVLPGPEWVKIRPILAGVCGTDMAAVTLKSSPSLSPFSSFPAVMGHEVVGRVVEVGEKAREAVRPGPAGAIRCLEPGQRVVVDAFLPCAVRSIEPPCPSCARGEPYVCQNMAEGATAPAILFGFSRDLPGSWSEAMVAHRTQVFPVPDEVSDERAVLVEPFSIALRAVTRLITGVSDNGPWAGTVGTRPVLDLDPPPEKVLIIGAGTVGLLVLAAIKLLKWRTHVTIIARHGFQGAMAMEFGADAIYGSGGNGRGALAAAREITKAKAYRPILGREVLTGGFDAVFDCVGSARSLDDALRVARPGGTIVLVGTAGQIAGLDWTFVWAKELKILGSVGYGMIPEAVAAVEPAGTSAGLLIHTHELALRLMAENPGFRLEKLITHRFPLREYREGIRMNLGRGRRRGGTLKTVFYP